LGWIGYLKRLIHVVSLR